jgi:cytochrome c
MSKNPAFMTYLGLSLLVGIWVFLFAYYGGEILYHPKEIDKPAYPLIEGEEMAAAEEATETGTAAPAAEEAAPADNGEGIATLLASADQEAGAKVSKKCGACHSFDKGGPNKVGPNLWDIVGRAVASHEGYSYSGALSDMGGEWSYESLNAFLTKPKDFVTGTKMSFAGLKSAEDRANLIAFLRSLSDDPKPLP